MGSESMDSHTHEGVVVCSSFAGDDQTLGQVIECNTHRVFVCVTKKDQSRRFVDFLPFVCLSGDGFWLGIQAMFSQNAGLKFKEADQSAASQRSRRRSAKEDGWSFSRVVIAGFRNQCCRSTSRP